jgi:hypothetical protein
VGAHISLDALRAGRVNPWRHYTIFRQKLPAGNYELEALLNLTRIKGGKEEVKGAALYLGRPTEWARTVICETAPFDLAPLPEQRLCQGETIPESTGNASFLAGIDNHNIH